MSRFAQAMNASSFTNNGALSYGSPDPSNLASGRLSLFFKGCRGLTTPTLFNFLEQSAKENLIDTFLLAFHLRDVRQGKGERFLGRQALLWLFTHYPIEFEKVMKLIPEYGRWDDLLHFFPSVANFTDYKTIVNEDSLKEIQNKVVMFMAEQLKEDQKNMEAGKPCSLCAKWTPTEGCGLDRKYDIFKTLATALHTSPKILRTKYNTPLRAYLEITEKYMCCNQWGKIDFNKVPSCTMKRLQKAFEKHDKNRFEQWKKDLVSGDGSAKVNAKTLHPHELVSIARKTRTVDEVTEAQWKVLVSEVKKLGSLKDAVVVVDTSSSMHTPNFLPLDVAVSLGLIISEVVEGPFHGQAITFNSVPQFCVIPDGNLQTRYERMSKMPWGGSTNIEGTFKLILNRATECKLAQEDMPKRLIIISDMQFNAIEGIYRTNMEQIDKLYDQYNYKRPQIVFWNVNGSSNDFPVTVNHDNTVMLSGFSPSILKSLLQGTDFNPLSILRTTLDDKRYDAVREALVEENQTEFELIDEDDTKL